MRATDAALIRALSAAALTLLACQAEPDRLTVRGHRVSSPAEATPGDAGTTGDAPDLPDTPDAAPATEVTPPDADTDTDLVAGSDASPGSPETAATDASGAPETARVSHPRELRAVWVATVWNINFPSRRGLSVAALKAELDALVATTAEAGLNAIVFQVRPEGDAMYASTLEPWSRSLTGTQGRDPGLDPLAYLLESAHARSLEVHAWLNPYRAKTDAAAATVAPHIASLYPEHVYAYDGLGWMDPGVEVVQQRLLDVVADLVTRYPLDGVHFDDYFYPYPDGPFPDSATYAAYKASGGALSLEDWRRDNVNRMVGAVHRTIRALDPGCRFGIAPFGIYRPGQPAGITGLDQYRSLYADPKRWILDGHVDYVAPQLYWPTTQTAQAYEPLLRWWTEVRPGQLVLAGNNLTKVGSSASWSVAEFREQLRISRALRAGGSLGNIWYHIAPLMENTAGIRDVFASEFYASPALSPPMPGAEARIVAPPVVSAEASGADLRLTIRHAAGEEVRAAAVYRQVGEGWSLVAVLPRHATEGLISGPGPLAISTVTRDGAESLGVVIRP